MHLPNLPRISRQPAFARLRVHALKLKGSKQPTRRCVNRNFNGKLNRNGLSLLEVILSIAILGTSMVIIGEVFFSGYRSAVKARDLSDATLICDSVMAELAAGSIELESTSGAQIPGVQGWEYSVETVESAVAGLLLTTVAVGRQGDQNISMSIVRMLPDPDYEPGDQ